MNGRGRAVDRWGVKAWWRTALFVLCCAPSAARAQPAEARRLEVVREPGTEACPDTEGLAAAVQARLGYAPFAPDAVRLITVRLRAGARGLSATVEVGGPDGQVRGRRTLRSPEGDCAELASALALAIAIAIDPVRARAEPEPPPPSEQVAIAQATGTEAPAETATIAAAGTAPPATEAPATTPPAPPPPPAARSSARATVRVETRPRARPIDPRVALGSSVAIWAAPEVAPGLLARLGVVVGRASVDLEGRWDFPTTNQPAGPRVESALRLVSLVGCLQTGPAGTRLLASGCALVTVGVLEGRGLGVDVPETDSTLYSGAGLRAGVELQVVGPLGVALHAEVLRTLTRTHLDLSGEPAWWTPDWSMTAGLGVVGRLP
jgi:hypothetical protein